jgi:glycosyltransferase involved in cell wall biosynthesis
MRVLMLNNEFPPLGGGTGTVNRALLERFAQAPGLEIDLFTSALGMRPERESFGERVQIYKLPVANRNIHHSSNRELLTYAAQALAAARARHAAAPYDLCMAWSAVPAGAVALALRRLGGPQYIVRVCGPDIPGFEERYGALYPVLTPTIRATWRGAAAVVAKCDAEAAMIHAVDRGVDVTLVPNGVDLHAFMPAPIAADGPLRIICVARLIERKGQHHLIAALRALIDAGVDATLDLVGEGDARGQYEAQAAALGLREQVRFSGYVAREAIAARYAAADVFVLPSYNEGMSVATLEALAAGLPAVITRTGGAAELVEEGINGATFDWGDVARLAALLRTLAEDRALLRRMGAASRARAARFTWDAAAARFLDLFRIHAM